MKTYSMKASEIDKRWVLIDADGLILGRLAAIVADRLRGQHKPTYTPHMDCGDHVVIVNAEKVRLTGAKLKDKVYYRHTGHPGGIKSATAGEILDGRYPERVILKAVERMLPKSKLGRTQLGHLRVYPGPDNPHAAQQPELLDVAGMNPKNKRN
ncbi:MAG: 50S ribosomal protein L13 [Alphaproteobacteria bacterium]